MATKTKKKCTRCGATKALDKFQKDKRSADGTRGQCLECRRKRDRAREGIHVKPSKKEEPVPSGLPENIEDRLAASARRQAILTLIGKHRTEFNFLVKNEYRKRGIKEQAPTWVNVTDQ